ncbi:hypothetical protein ACIQI8_41985 [Streptomyces sp. NPDC092369]|uniref:hypothetical protein n=1 Tax=Streptomyces sp. NPDC092369 TaxID=3366015 RepID=UPI003801720D
MGTTAYSWRTATSRRHPLGRGAAWPADGAETHHLATGTTPTPNTLLRALATHPALT